MPLIEKLACAGCGFETAETEGSILYTLAQGEEVVLAHPGELSILKNATGLDWQEAREQGLVRQQCYCVCFVCCARFYLDIDRQPKRCEECGSSDVRTFNGAIAEPCPSCHADVLRLIPVGVS